MKTEVIIGHVPLKVLCFKTLHSTHWTVTCEVTGHRKYGIGLKITCTYNFSAKKRQLEDYIRICISCMFGINFNHYSNTIE